MTDSIHNPKAQPRTAPGRGAAAARRSRGGSVLILVVALLVLMALIGTAWISTVRTDRYAVQQHAANTEVDMLVEGVVRMATASLSGDLFDNGTAFRLAPDETLFTGKTPPPPPPGQYEHRDLVMEDLHLSDRAPTLYDRTKAPSAGNPPVWRSITWPLTAGTSGAAPQFDRPDGGRPMVLPGQPGVFPPTGTLETKANFLFAPTSRPFNGRPAWPHLDVFHVDFVGGNGVQHLTALGGPWGGPIPAADVDGDGVADAGLWKLPVGEINGITYFAAVRIIDNNSAINASTAWKPNEEFRSGASGMPPEAVTGDFFPANVDLQGALFAGGISGAAQIRQQQLGQMQAFNNYRFFGPPAAGPRYDRTGAVTAPVQDHPQNPVAAGTARTDFSFVSVYDQFYHQLIRRIDGPGQYLANRRFRALGNTDAAKLAYKFILYNPEDTTPSGVEQWLQRTLRPGNRLVTDRPYTADNVFGWFSVNFDWPTAGRNPSDEWNRRPLLVARNPLANVGAAHPIADLPADVTEAVPPGNVTTPDDGLRRWQTFTEMQKMPTADLAGNRPMRKASINTADFNELWRAFWMVMHRKGVAGNLPPYPVTMPGTPELRRMFRSPIRDPRLTNASNAPYLGSAPATGEFEQLGPSQMLLLRSAIAAVNAMDLRDSDDDVTSRRILLPADPAVGSRRFEATVYGTEKQPFITEVYVENDNTTPHLPARATNPKGYIAIELHNPHPVPLDIGGWTLGILDRRPEARFGNVPPPPPNGSPGAPTDPFPSMNLRPITGFAGFPAGTIIPPNSYRVLENYADPTVPGVTPDPVVDAGGRPTFDGTLPAGVALYVHNLHEVLFDPDLPANASGELVLLRPRRSDGVAVDRTRAHPNSRARSNTQRIFQGEVDSGALQLHEMVPVDSHDFTGYYLESSTAPPMEFKAWHYVRTNGLGAAAWRCVYPGRWDPMHPWDPTPPGTRQHRQQGVQEMPFLPTVTRPLTLTTALGLGAADAVSTYDTAPNYNPTVPIQLNNFDFAGPNKVTGTGTNTFPFGGFARNGDILQVPYIGAYRLRYLHPTIDTPMPGPRTGSPNSYAGQVLELNAVTMDCAFADDFDTATAITNAVEQIGRFCPITAMADPLTAPAALPAVDYYHWAGDLFDYLTVQAPHDDYLPNVNRDDYAYRSPGDASTATSPYGYTMHPPPQATPNTGAPANTANGGREDQATVEGLININTAPWRVLAALPMVIDPTTGAILPDENRALAQAIVDYRDGKLDDPVAFPPHGPFKTLFDLNKIPGFAIGGNPTGGSNRGKIAANHAGLATANPGRDEGDISPRTPPTGTDDGVVGDFEARFLMMNRISNLVTTRSDSYTCYVLVQGWRGVGSANPELVVQRRRAFIADRTGVTPTNRDVATQNFYNE